MGQNPDIIVTKIITIIRIMKSKIHPTIYTNTQVLCSSCGHTFTTASTKKEIHIEVCSKCHPYFTGEHRFIDAKGRVEHFQKKQEFAQKMQEVVLNKKTKRKEEKEEKTPKTLKELLSEI